MDDLAWLAQLCEAILFPAFMKTVDRIPTERAQLTLRTNEMGRVVVLRYKRIYTARRPKYVPTTVFIVAARPRQHPFPCKGTNWIIELTRIKFSIISCDDSTNEKWCVLHHIFVCAFCLFERLPCFFRHLFLETGKVFNTRRIYIIERRAGCFYGGYLQRLSIPFP